MFFNKTILTKAQLTTAIPNSNLGIKTTCFNARSISYLATPQSAFLTYTFCTLVQIIIFDRKTNMAICINYIAFSTCTIALAKKALTPVSTVPSTILNSTSLIKVQTSLVHKQLFILLFLIS